ncbi:unnamed protein product [Mytilus coruscus]|uniref:Ig-like domain-containing protein n=1 Tax=Mytilus coruscus TaxID=42192 RepID=A0A6J8ETW7_MYTCO|nr:unnamed protein product [Mytilus coruscus]
MSHLHELTDCFRIFHGFAGRPPKDIRVYVNGNTTKISWGKISTDEGVTWSRIYLYSSNEGNVDLDLERGSNFRDLQFPSSSFDIANLKMCSEYYVKIRYIRELQYSEFTTQKFWITTTPNLTFRPEHPFVGNAITFICNSVVHWCPGDVPSDLSMTYKFLGNQRGDTDKNTLTIHALAKSDKGIHISCQVTDDRGKVFYLSDTVTLDPYYSPDNIFLEPANTAINVREGTTLGPIHCTATCNPECTYHWEYNVTGRFEFVPIKLVSNQGRTLTVLQIKRSQTGTFRCHVEYYFSQIKKTADVSINVQYGPDIIILEPASTDINVTEGTTLGPIHCTATCNPECKYQWEYNVTGRFEFIQSNSYQTMAGLLLCHK